MTNAVRPIKLAFVGDSITRGVDAGVGISTTGGFRWTTWEYIAGDYTVELVGAITDNLGDWDHHEGHNGNGIGGASGGPGDQLDDWISNLVTYKVDIVCLMIGINDIIQPWSTAPIIASMPTRLGALLDAYRVARPNIRVLLGSIMPIDNPNPAYQSAVDTYNAALPGVASARSAWCTFVDTAAGVNAVTDTNDSTHLNDLGFAKVATAWMTALPAVIADFAATDLVDGNTLLNSPCGEGTDDRRGDGGGQHLWFLTEVAAASGRSLPALTSVVDSPLNARVEYGNWVVQCTTCRENSAVWMDRLLLFCSNCWNSATGGQWRTVAVPDTATRSEIERLLGYRAEQYRFWLPTESVADLQAQNVAHGLSA